MRSFWKGLVGDNEIISDKRCQKAFEALLANKFSGQLERKEMGNDYIYIIRLNDADRLLFAAVQAEYQGENGKIRLSSPFIVPLEIADNHDYQKAKFLKLPVFKAYLDKNIESIKEQILAKLKTNDKNALSLTHSSAKLKFTNVRYHDKLIALDSVQENVVKMKLPMVVGGAAGSGKTTVLEAILEDYVLSEEHRGKNGLCVAKSPKLLASLKARYESMLQRNYPNGLPPNIIHMQFKTPEELIVEQEAFANHQVVGVEDFKDWAKNYLEKQAQVGKSKNKGKGKGKERDSSNLDKLYEECGIISARNKEQYLALGEGQAKFSKDKREDLYALYKAYEAYLSQNKKVNRDIQATELGKKYDLVLVDEAQDLSYLQLKKITGAAKESQFCCLMDSHQSLFDSQSKRPFLLNELEVKGVDLTYCQLPVIYRCPLKIAKFAERIIQLKNVVTGGIADKLEQYKIEVNQEEGKAEGEVVWQEDDSQAAIDAFKRPRKATETAIITLPQFKEEAKKLFGTALVFTPEEIKGLEYPAVACYKLFEDDGFKEANKIASSVPVAQYESFIHRPKREGGEDNKSFAPLFNRLFTACTRASEVLYIFQKKHHHIEHLSNYLENKAANKKVSDTAPSVAAPVAGVETTQADWKEQVRQLLANGNENQAREVFIKQRLGSLADFEKLLSGDSVSSQEKIVSNTPVKIKNETKVMLSQSSASPQPSQLNTNQHAKRLKYLNDLYKDFTLANLNRLFNHKSCVEFLFETPFNVNGTNCLFDAIVSDNEKPSIFRRALSSNNQFFNQLNNHTPKIVKALCSPFKHPMLGSSSALYWLSCYPGGREILKMMLEKSPSLAEQIPVDDWCRVVSVPDCGEVSALYWLIANPEGREILRMVLENNPSLAEQISVEAWCRVVKSPTRGEVSALYWLSAYPNGREIWKMMLEKNPSLAEQIPVEAWCRLVKDPEFGEVSAHYWLSASQKGREILKMMLENNPSLAKQIPVEAWCWAVKTSDFGEVPALYWLSRNPEGREVLKIMLEKNPSLAEQIPVEAWCRLVTIPPSGEASVLYWLSYYPEGLEILKMMLEKNPSLAKQIPVEAWCRLVKGPACGEVSALYCLSGSKRGREILKMMLEKNPSLAEKIPAEAWCWVIKIPARGEVSALYWLSNSREGQEIFKAILIKNPRLAEQIPAKAMAMFLGKLVLTDISDLFTILVERNPNLEMDMKEIFESHENGKELFEAWRNQYENHLKLKANGGSAVSALVNHSLFNRAPASSETFEQMPETPRNERTSISQDFAS